MPGPSLSPRRPRRAPAARAGLLLLVPALFVGRPLEAATLRVPSDRPTVREACDAAFSGDTILIAPGVHAGGVYVRGKSVTVGSWFLTSGDTAYIAQTVIDSVYGAPCGGSTSCAGNAVLEFASDASGSAIVGLTIRHGEDGVRSRGVVDIAWCHITGNADGIDYQSGSGGVIRNSLFAWNTDDGIDLNGQLDATIRDNVIRDNHQDGVEFRLYAYRGPVKRIDFIGNRFLGNGGDGIQLIDYPDTSDRVIRIEGNLFSGNLDASVGCMPDGQTGETFVGAPLAERVYLIRNTFRGEHYGFVGGGNVIALDNIFTGTQASAVRRVRGNSIVSYGLFWNNGIDHEESNIDLPHLLHADPLLGPTGVPAPGSPAIDAGTAFFQWLGETVLDLPPTAYAGSAPDIGAFETGSGDPGVNAPPVVGAGPDLTITLPAGAALDGTVSDDGLPFPPGVVTTAWSVASGPGAVSFQDAGATDTQASFISAGTYVLTLSGSDGALSGSDQVQVTVQSGPPVGGGTVERRIAAGGDDAEENATGGVDLSSSDVELVNDGTNQTVGLRFTGVAIPPGAVITTAYLQFETDEVKSEATSLVFRAQAADNASPFATTAGNISTRARTASSASWSPAAWTLVGEAGPGQRTPELRSLIQEVVNRPGWASGNAVAIVVTGTGRRTACAYEGDATGAALLHVQFGDGGGPPPANTAPVVDAGPDRTITLPADALLDGTVGDDGLPIPPGAVLTTWSVAAGPGPVSFLDASAIDTRASFTLAGAYLLRLMASDGSLSATDSMQVTVQPAPPPGAASLERRIAASADDAEESATGKVSTNGTDLELVYDRTNQRVGLRFTGVGIPPGATVTRAYVQFTADEVQSEATNLLIQGQAADNPAAFTTIAGNVSARPRTASSASWSPAAWSLIGEAAANQRTPDLSMLIQEIVSRPGWASGNALALVITGTGHRTAETCDGKAAAAALLHVEYTVGAPPTIARSQESAGDSPRVALALHAVSPNPTRGPLQVEFSLADGGPASLELWDLAGRRVAKREVGALGAGRHRAELKEDLPAGIYLVRIRQGGNERVTKAVVLK